MYLRRIPGHRVIVSLWQGLTAFQVGQQVSGPAGTGPGAYPRCRMSDNRTHGEKADLFRRAEGVNPPRESAGVYQIGRRDFKSTAEHPGEFCQIDVQILGGLTPSARRGSMGMNLDDSTLFRAGELR